MSGNIETAQEGSSSSHRRAATSLPKVEQSANQGETQS
jgi:hypothetical protein